MIGALARKFFGSANDRRVRKYQPRVDAINALEGELAKLSDESRPVAATMAFAALRVSEVLGLRWQDVDLKGGVIHVRGQAGGTTGSQHAPESARPGEPRRPGRRGGRPRGGGVGFLDQLHASLAAGGGTLRE